MVKNCARNRSTLCLKKRPTITLSLTLSNLNRFSKFLHCSKAYEICYKSHITIPPYIKNVAALPWEIKHSNFLQIFSRYEKHANKLHFECTDCNSCMRVTVWWVYLCIYCLVHLQNIWDISAYEGIAIFFGKMRVALTLAGCCVVAFGGSEKSRLVTASTSARSDVTLLWRRLVFVAPTRHSPMTVCGMLDQVLMRRRLRSAVSRTAVLQTRSCMRPHTR